MRTTARRQDGAALIEFALVLPLLLAIAVGIIYYGYAYVLSAAVEQAAKNGAEAAVAVSPLVEDYEARLKDRAKAAALQSLDWLPASVDAALADNPPEVLGPGTVCDGQQAFGVAVSLALTGGANPVLPQFKLGSVEIPPLPAGSGGKFTIRRLACVTL